MKMNKFWYVAGTACALIALSGMAAGRADAATNYRVVYDFSGGTDGGNAATALILDHAGNAYGTTVSGGSFGFGVVFRLKPVAHGPWMETPLFSFSGGSDGKNPHGGVTFDGTGNLDGTTVAGGFGGFCTGDGCGVVFNVSPTGEAVLHDFSGNNDGFGPGGQVVFDTLGNIYGETPDGGRHSNGTIYQLTIVNGNWHHTVIHNFTGGSDGAIGSLGPLLVDGTGNLFGVTELGGAHKAGMAFKLSPAAGGRWVDTVLYAFKGQPDAAFPYGGLIADSHGNLFGTTYFGGANGLGAIFELLPTAHGPWTEHVLYSFKGGTDGSLPTTTLAFDGSGNLFGTTSTGGNPGCDCGTIFKLAPNLSETIVHRFGTAPDGADPYYGLTADGHGHFLGTTVAGGINGQGTVFEFTP